MPSRDSRDRVNIGPHPGHPTRRAMLVSATAALTTLNALAASANDPPSDTSAQPRPEPQGATPSASVSNETKPDSAAFTAALARILAGNDPQPGPLTLDIPETADNGNTVPFTLAVDSPMSPDDHVRALHLLATQNPVAHVAAFTLSPLAGKALVSSRMRLSGTQDVVAVAALSNGKYLIQRKNIKVTIGGCGAG